jgi:hypothetical protein
MLQMEDFMTDSEEAQQQLKKDFIDKATEYIKDKVHEFTGISL